MEKNIPLSANANLATTVLSVINILKAPFFMLRDYYSGIIGKKLSNGQTWQLIEVQVAFFLTVFPAECNLLVRVLLMVWFINSILRLRNSLYAESSTAEFWFRTFYSLFSLQQQGCPLPLQCCRVRNWP